MSATVDPFNGEILAVRTKLFNEEEEADGAFTHCNRQTFASSSTYSSITSSSKSVEFSSLESTFDSDTNDGAFGSGAAKMRQKTTRKCFLIDSLLEERQKKLAAAAAASATLSSSHATSPTDAESNAGMDHGDKMQTISEYPTSSNICENGEVIAECDESAIDNFSSDFTSSSTSSNPDKVAQIPAGQLTATSNLFTNSTSNKQQDGKGILSPRNLKNVQQDGDVDYAGCLRALQNMMANVQSTTLHPLADNPLLLLHIMNGATIAKQQQQQQKLLLHQQAALALRSRVAALIAANSLHKESIVNNRRLPVPGKSKLFTPPSVNGAERTVSTISLPCNVGRTRSSLPHRSSNAKKYRCDICEKTFSRSNTLITHKRIHTGEKPFQCEHCGRAFRQPGNLTRHAYTHTTVKPFVCGECGKAFNRASNLHTHMRVHNTDQATSGANGLRMPNSVIDLPNQSNASHQLSLLLERAAAASAAGDACASCGQQFASRLDLRAHQCQGRSLLI